MSKALPGEHYCKNHQGNHSHYAPHNCTVCTQATEIERLRAERESYKQDAERYRWIRIEQNLDRVYEFDGEVLDQMIDAARKGEGE